MSTARVGPLLPADTWHKRAVRLLTVLLSLAVVVSIVHYSDNYVNYHDYPQSASLPNPSATLVLLSWFAFTGAGLAGYGLFRRDPSRLSIGLLAVYSGSGLVGIGHYTAAGATDMPWWRQAHVILDIACGVGMFVFCLWAARNTNISRQSPSTRHGSSARTSDQHRSRNGRRLGGGQVKDK
jgi:hypothetical protein